MCFSLSPLAPRSEQHREKLRRRGIGAYLGEIIDRQNYLPKTCVMSGRRHENYDDDVNVTVVVKCWRGGIMATCGPISAPARRGRPEIVCRTKSSIIVAKKAASVNSRGAQHLWRDSTRHWCAYRHLLGNDVGGRQWRRNMPGIDEGETARARFDRQGKCVA